MTFWKLLKKNFFKRNVKKNKTLTFFTRLAFSISEIWLEIERGWFWVLEHFIGYLDCFSLTKTRENRKWSKNYNKFYSVITVIQELNKIMKSHFDRPDISQCATKHFTEVVKQPG